MQEQQPNLHPRDYRGDKLWWHRWGYEDTAFVADPKTRHVVLTGDRYAFCGYPMPYLIPYLERNVGVSLDLENLRPEVKDPSIAPSQRNEAFCQAVAKQFPDHTYTFDDKVRLRHSHGQTIPSEISEVLYGQLKRHVDMVFFCESEAEAERLIQLATDHNICLVPYGGGTSVSGALTLPAEESRMIVAVNTLRMNQIEWIDTENNQACVQAGVSGQQLEAALEEKGFTCGHKPDSMEHSTVGGWISTNASGMKKNRYGNIEDIVQGITLLTPDGLIEQSVASPRVAMGMQLQKLLFGSEGNLGLITKAVIRIRPLPEVQEYGTLLFPGFRQGTAFLQALSQTNYIPASIRLVDSNQFQFGRALRREDKNGPEKLLKDTVSCYLSKVRNFNLKEMVVATVVMEGTNEEVAYQKKSINTLVRQFNGFSAGKTGGKRGYGLTFAIAYIRDFLSSLHIFGDACETTVPWSKIEAVIENVTKELETQHKKHNLPGKPFLSYRIPQIYQTGVCIYFMIGFYAKGVEHPGVVLEEIDYAIRGTIINHGGSISHHHGVGKLRKDFLRDTISRKSLKILREIKDSTDPTNVFGIRNNVCAILNAGPED